MSIEGRVADSMRCLAIAALVGGCTTRTSPTVGPQAIVPPPCTSVTYFGNGEACSSADPTLGACGTLTSRLCSGGWLCYDAPEFAECSCTTDADCAGKRAYIQAARIAQEKSPTSVTCHGGRCIEGL